MNTHIFATETELIAAFATYFIQQARQRIQSQGFFNVALAGGSSPKRVYELLASPEYSEQVEWTKVYFFFGDERYVPADDPLYNGLMADLALFHPLQIPETQVFKVDTSLTPREAAEKYKQTISSHFKGEKIRFDLIILGLGDDAHTASLFPFTDVLQEREPSVRAVFLPKEKVYRISMTAPLINQAKQIAFLVFGEKKAVAVQQVRKGCADHEKFPAQLIKPVSGELHWFLDKKAAAFL